MMWSEEVVFTIIKDYFNNTNIKLELIKLSDCEIGFKVNHIKHAVRFPINWDSDIVSKCIINEILRKINHYLK